MSEHDTEVAPTPVQTGTKRSQESSDGPVNKRPHIDIDDSMFFIFLRCVIFALLI